MYERSMFHDREDATAGRSFALREAVLQYNSRTMQEEDARAGATGFKEVRFVRQPQSTQQTRPVLREVVPHVRKLVVRRARIAPKRLNYSEKLSYRSSMNRTEGSI